jgi:hypothetical protein
LAENWRWNATICPKVGSEYLLELRYEELVTETEKTLRTICDFLGECFVKEMLDYHRTAEEHVPRDSQQWHRNSMRPPDVSKVYVWKQKLSVSDQIIFEQIAGSTLEMFGYECRHRKGTLASKMKSLYYMTVARW